jgi:hypothetical protein
VSVEDEELRRFLFEHVDDLEDLEIVARFHELGDDRLLNAVEVAVLTRFPVATTTDALARLSARGVLAPTATEPVSYGYVIADASLHERLARAVAEYRREPIKVMGMMTTNAIERVRTAAIRTFAECFRIGGPKSNG